MKRILLAFLITAAASNSAFAHLNPAEHGSFAAGFSHPFFGLDHILAMVAVGLWAALLGGRAIWLVPTAFVGMMLAGFGVALGGAQLPFVEPIILTSVVAIGLFAARLLRASPAGRHGDGRLFRLLPRPCAWRRAGHGGRVDLQRRLRPRHRVAARGWPWSGARSRPRCRRRESGRTRHADGGWRDRSSWSVAGGRSLT